LKFHKPTGTAKIKERLPSVRSGISEASGVECADLRLKDGDVLEVGALRLEVRLEAERALY
jgi:hypothetical protein